MVAFRCFLLGSVAAVADALQQPTQLVTAKETDGAFRVVSSQMDELHAGLAKAKLDNLNALTQRKEELDLALEKLVNRNRDTMHINTKLASDIRSIGMDNAKLRKIADNLTVQCKEINADLSAMQSNVTMAQEFINRSITTSNLSLSTHPELQILADLDSKDAAKQREMRHEDHLNTLEQLGAAHVAMMQVGATEKNRTQELLEELFSSFKNVSGQQNTSLQSLQAVYDKESDDLEKKYMTLLDEQKALNATKADAEALRVKLQAAVDYLKTTRSHLDKQRLLLKRFAARLGATRIDGMVTPTPLSLDLPGYEEAVLLEEPPVETGLLALSSWFKSLR